MVLEGSALEILDGVDVPVEVGLLAYNVGDRIAQLLKAAVLLPVFEEYAAGALAGNELLAACTGNRHRRVEGLLRAGRWARLAGVAQQEAAALVGAVDGTTAGGPESI